MDTADTTTVSGILRSHTRLLIVFGCASVAVLALAAAAVGRALLGSYEELEIAAARQRAEQVYRAFDADLRQLAISNRDYAEWDAAQEFVATRDPAFIPGNFSAAQLQGMDVDIVWIADDTGDLHSAYVDPSSGALTTPLPGDLLESLRPFHWRADSLRMRSPAERTIRTPRGLIGVSAVRIARSDGSQPTNATLLFARIIEADDLERIGDTSRLPVSMAEDIVQAALPDEVRQAMLDGRESPFQVHPLTSKVIASYAVVRNVDDHPVAVLSTEALRDIRAIGLRTTFLLLGSMVALLLIFGIVCFVLLTRLVALQRRVVTHRRNAREQQRENRRILVKQAQRDFLTGLPNRLYAQARIPRLIAKMADAEGLLAVVHIDLDHFKNVNESLGHAKGDQLLRIVARRLRAAVAKTDLVARMGGDEFVVVASLLPDASAVERLVRRLHMTIAADLKVDKKAIRVTGSMGVALYPRDGLDAEVLLKRSDIALYQAKEAGRRCHRFFAAEMDARVNEHAAIEQDLRRALGTPQIYLDYQPIIDMHDGRVVSLEALMRWRHPERGAIPPAQFIPVAEKSGLIVELGHRALQEVLAQQRSWLDAQVPVVPIAVNVSTLQVDRVDFAKLVERLAAAAGVDPKWVRFEITESAMTKEPEKLIGTMRALRELGSQVLLDDFGTGYSSLSYLNRLPIDIVKIDRSFVRDIGNGEQPSPVIPAVIDMAKRLNLKTVAEGVETAVQAAILCDLGCDYAQGYFYSKPVLAHQCRSLLEHLRRERALSHTLIARVVTT